MHEEYRVLKKTLSYLCTPPVLSGCCLKNPQSKHGPNDCGAEDSPPCLPPPPDIELEDITLLWLLLHC